MPKSELEELDDEFGFKNKAIIPDNKKGFGKNWEKRERLKAARKRIFIKYMEQLRKENGLP